MKTESTCDHAKSAFQRIRGAPYETATGEGIKIGPTITSRTWEVSIQLNDGDSEEGRENVVDVVIRPRSDVAQFDHHSHLIPSGSGLTFALNGSKLAELGRLLIASEHTLRELGMGGADR